MVELTIDQLTADQKDHLVRPINEVVSLQRASKGLEAEGIYYVFQALEKPEDELLRIPNVGRKTTNELRQTGTLDLEAGASISFPASAQNVEDQIAFIRGEYDTSIDEKNELKTLRVEFARAVFGDKVAFINDDKLHKAVDEVEDDLKSVLNETAIKCFGKANAKQNSVFIKDETVSWINRSLMPDIRGATSEAFARTLAADESLLAEFRKIMAPAIRRALPEILQDGFPLEDTVQPS